MYAFVAAYTAIVGLGVTAVMDPITPIRPTTTTTVTRIITKAISTLHINSNSSNNSGTCSRVWPSNNPIAIIAEVVIAVVAVILEHVLREESGECGCGFDV